MTQTGSRAADFAVLHNRVPRRAWRPLAMAARKSRLPTNAMIALTDAQLRQVQALLSSIYTGTLMLTEKTPQRIKCEYRTAAGGRRPDLEHFRTIQGAGTGFGLWFCVGSTARSLGGRILARRIPSVG
jgi:hypothetical protein